MGYGDETERSGQRQSRGRQPVKRTGSRRMNQRGSREPGHSEPGLNLITDTFSDKSRRRPIPKPAEKTKSRRSRNSRRAKAETAAAHQTGAVPGLRGKEKAKRKWKIRVILFEITLLLSVLLFAGYSYVNGRFSEMQNLPWNPEEIRNVGISAEKQEQMEGYWDIAIFGVDSRDSSLGKGNNSDVIMLCNINHDSGEIKLVSVYRDTYLNVSEKNSYNKINRAYLTGGPELAVKMLNKNLDLDIDDYVTFNWKSVADAINMLGGIDLEITRSEYYYMNAFINETVKATGVPSYPLEHAGMVHLDGVQAVAYGRLRLMDTDYARTERQQKVIALALEKAKQADWATLYAMVDQIFVKQVSTSVELNDVILASQSISKYHLSGTAGFPEAKREINFTGKGDCVIPNTLESNVIELHRFLFGDDGYTPTDVVKTISRKIIADSGASNQRRPESTSAAETTRASTEAENSLEESTADEDVTSPYWQSRAPGQTGESSSGQMYPGQSTANETDSDGNLILPSGDYPSETGESRQPSSSYGSTLPDETTGGTSGTRPNQTVAPSASGPSGQTEGGVSRPGTGQTNPGGGTNGGGTNAPGSNTDTGVIIAPGSNRPGSGTSSTEAPPRVEYYSPPGS